MFDRIPVRLPLLIAQSRFEAGYSNDCQRNSYPEVQKIGIGSDTVTKRIAVLCRPRGRTLPGIVEHGSAVPPILCIKSGKLFVCDRQSHRALRACASLHVEVKYAANMRTGSDIPTRNADIATDLSCCRCIRGYS